MALIKRVGGLFSAGAFLLFAVLGGLWSLQVGLTWDEQTEQGTFNVIAGAVKAAIAGHPDAITHLQGYQDKYYGIGFHAISYPVQLVLAPLLSKVFGVDHDAAMLLAKHLVVFLFFCGSIVVFHRFVKLLVDDPRLALLFSAAYAAYPYLLGHALFNVKDLPYASVYLLCTYLSVRISKARIEGRVRARLGDMAALLLATALLVAIRIPGVVILAQYSITFVAAEILAKRNGASGGWRSGATSVIAFLLLMFLLVIAAYPAFWLHPLRGPVEALRFMLKHPGDTCTLTWGTCMWAQSLPWTYLPGWLLVKLPLFGLSGLALAALMWRRILADPAKAVAVLALVVGVSYPLVSGIAFRAVFYDETRQLLFVYPLILVLACAGWRALSKRAAAFAALASLAGFVADDVALAPYQYAYVNEAARFLRVERLFDTDYWGASGRELSAAVSPILRAAPDAPCVFAEPAHLYRPFLPKGVCVRELAELDRRPAPAAYLVATYNRRMRFSGWRPDRPGCQRVAVVSRRYPVSGQRIDLASAYLCRSTHP